MEWLLVGIIVVALDFIFTGFIKSQLMRLSWWHMKRVYRRGIQLSPHMDWLLLWMHNHLLTIEQRVIIMIARGAQRAKMEMNHEEILDRVDALLAEHPDDDFFFGHTDDTQNVDVLAMANNAMKKKNEV